jgi:hypothetical protein
MSPTTISLLQLLLNLVLGGGLLASLLRHRVQMRGEDRSDFEMIVEALRHSALRITSVSPSWRGAVKIKRPRSTGCALPVISIPFPIGLWISKVDIRLSISPSKNASLRPTQDAP